MKKSLIFVGMLAIGYANAQEYDGKVGINTNEPKATFDITAYKTDGTTKEGLLMPRMRKVDIAKIASPETSTIVYINNVDYTEGADVNANSRVANIDAVGFYYYNGTQWIRQDKYEWDRKKVTIGSNTDDISYLINTDSPSHVTYNTQTGQFSIHSAQTERNDTPLWVRWEPININGAKYTQEGYASVSTVQTQPNTQFSILSGSFSNISINDDSSADTAIGIRVHNNFGAKSTNKESIGVYARANIYPDATMGNHTGIYSYVSATTPKTLNNVYYFRTGQQGPFNSNNMYGLYVDDIDRGITSNYAVYTKKGKIRVGDLAGTGSRPVFATADGVLTTGGSSAIQVGNTDNITCTSANAGTMNYKEVERNGQQIGVFGFCIRRGADYVWAYMAGGSNIFGTSANGAAFGDGLQ